MARIKPSHRTPWSYRAGTTALHRCPAGIKLILFLLLSAAPFFGAPFAGAAALLVLAGAFCAGIKIGDLLAGSMPLAVMLVVFAVFRAFSLDQRFFINTIVLQNGLCMAANILICFAAASLFFATTTVAEIRKTLAGIELFLFHRQGRVSLALALMLGFLPRFFECWESAGLASRARCCSGAFKRVAVILPLVTERMIETAAETAEALISRGYE